ncbi:MAG: UMP kinase [Candidatus Kerfeldbacteria bacterium]|jgi:uridylate kinase
MKNKETFVISLGGSLIVPNAIDIIFLKKFRKIIIDKIKKGHRFIIVTGGGDAARKYQNAAKKIAKVSTKDLDWVGIAATKINAELVRVIFNDYAYKEILSNPNIHIKTNKKILIGSGWVPGFSSDKDAVLLAKTYGAKTVINMSNISYVYTADPKKVKSAKPIKSMSWKEFLDLTGRKWNPGAHVPFDPEASKFAQKNKMKVIITKGTDIVNLLKILANKRAKGTVIE